jgi:hypothetical protein
MNKSYWYYCWGVLNAEKKARLYEVYHFGDINEDMFVPVSFWKALFKNPLILIKHLIKKVTWLDKIKSKWGKK